MRNVSRRYFLKYAITAGALLSTPKIVMANTKVKIIIGKSKIIIPNGAIIGTQVDRVLRDIHAKGTKYDINKNLSYAPITKKQELVPYMEGKLCGQLIEYANAMVMGLFPSYTKLEKNGSFYALGAFCDTYFVDPSKLNYASISKEQEQFIMSDTHGFNTIISALSILPNRNKNKYDVIIACMDLASKAEAALVLASAGINCYAPCDRHTSDLMGYSTKGTIIGSAPIKKHKSGAIIGDQPICVNSDEKVIVQTNSSDTDNNRYCDTPNRYFIALTNHIGISIDNITVNAGVGQTNKIIDIAENNHANIVMVRVNTEADRKPVYEWLKSSTLHRAILFHTMPYEGDSLFYQFPEQTTFGDLKPVLA